ncbi:uncharacterized protein TNCV_2938911 [Trichonephila clavipes]|nr:uncharacterized protein TNCV_2938911 [Trichonephila clavipes]
MIMKFEETLGICACCLEEDGTWLGLKLWKKTLLLRLKEPPVPSILQQDVDQCHASCRFRGRQYEKVIPALQEQQCSQTTIFMQEGATPHIGRQVKVLLSANFGDNHVISRHFPDAWPSRSPYLNTCDFWLWRFLKDCLYRRN